MPVGMKNVRQVSLSAFALLQLTLLDRPAFKGLLPAFVPRSLRSRPLGSWQRAKQHKTKCSGYPHGQTGVGSDHLSQHLQLNAPSIPRVPAASDVLLFTIVSACTLFHKGSVLIHTYTYIMIRTYRYIHTVIHTYTRLHSDAHTHTYAYTQRNAHIHTHSNIHIHTLIQ